MHAMGQACLVVFALLHVSVMKMIADTSVMKVSRPRRFVTRCGVRRGAVLHEYEKATNIDLRARSCSATVLCLLPVGYDF